MQWYTWNEYQNDLKIIINYCKMNEINHIVAIYRGSLVPATQLSNILDIPMSIIKFQTRDDNDKEPYFILDLIKDNDNVLVIDDIYDTGKTMDKIIELLKTKNIKIYPFVFFTKKLDIKHIYYANDWIVFPWED